MLGSQGIRVTKYSVCPLYIVLHALLCSLFWQNNLDYVSLTLLEQNKCISVSNIAPALQCIMVLVLWSVPQGGLAEQLFGGYSDVGTSRLEALPFVFLGIGLHSAVRIFT